MKNVSEVAIGLAYSALLFNDQSLAAEVSSLEDRLDEMRERLEVWVLRGGVGAGRAVAAARAAPPRWRGRGDRRRRAADGVAGRGRRGDAPDPRDGAGRQRRGDRAGARVARFVPRRPHARRGASSSSRPASTCSRSAAPAATSTGPRKDVQLEAGDELIASGPDEGPRAPRRARRLPRARGRRHRRDRPRPGRVLGRRRSSVDADGGADHGRRVGSRDRPRRDAAHGSDRGRGRGARRARAGRTRPASAPAAPSARSSGRTCSPASTRSSARCSW